MDANQLKALRTEQNRRSGSSQRILVSRQEGRPVKCSCIRLPAQLLRTASTLELGALVTVLTCLARSGAVFVRLRTHRCGCPLHARPCRARRGRSSEVEIFARSSGPRYRRDRGRIIVSSMTCPSVRKGACSSPPFRTGRGGARGRRRVRPDAKCSRYLRWRPMTSATSTPTSSPVGLAGKTRCAVGSSPSCSHFRCSGNNRASQPSELAHRMRTF